MGTSRAQYETLLRSCSDSNFTAELLCPQFVMPLTVEWFYHKDLVIISKLYEGSQLPLLSQNLGKPIHNLQKAEPRLRCLCLRTRNSRVCEIPMITYLVDGFEAMVVPTLRKISKTLCIFQQTCSSSYS